MRNIYNVKCGNVKRGVQTEDGRIILKEWVMLMWTGINWTKMGFAGGSCEHIKLFAPEFYI
jgi:hypothetical protein